MDHEQIARDLREQCVMAHRRGTRGRQMIGL